jgi:hypothetical protein
MTWFLIWAALVIIACAVLTGLLVVLLGLWAGTQQPPRCWKSHKQVKKDEHNPEA